MRKLSLKQVTHQAQHRPAEKWQNQVSQPGAVTPEPRRVTVTLHSKWVRIYTVCKYVRSSWVSRFCFLSLIYNRMSSRNTYKHLSEMAFLKTQIRKGQVILIAHIQQSWQQLIEIITVGIITTKQGPYESSHLPSHRTIPMSARDLRSCVFWIHYRMNTGLFS